MWFLAAADKTLRVFDVASGQCLHVLEAHEGGISDLSWTCDSRYVCSASDDKTVRIWDVVEVCCLNSPASSAPCVWGCMVRAMSGPQDALTYTERFCVVSPVLMAALPCRGNCSRPWKGTPALCSVLISTIRSACVLFLYCSIFSAMDLGVSPFWCVSANHASLSSMRFPNFLVAVSPRRYGCSPTLSL